MNITFRLNGENVTFDARPSQTLLDVLRENGVVGVKHGCETGECGACTVLLDGKPVSTCVMLAAQVEGHEVETIEGVGGQQQRGWRGSEPLHALQEAFVETGAIQCGYCTPGMIMAAKALLEENPNPTEAEVREALSGVLCRCTGYLKPVQAVLRAAAVMRGEEVPPIFQEGAVPVPEGLFKPVQQEEPPAVPTADGGTVVKTTPMPTMVVSEERARDYVGKPEPKVDALKLVQGKPAFTDDIEHRGMLVAKILWSPHAHALIKNIDVSKARELPGVHAVLTYKDLPRVPYTTAGQSHPEPGPHDNYSLDYKVRWVGDRVAAVAAETEEIAQRALDLIEVEYEVLPAIFDPREAMKPGAPIIHDEEESWNIEDRNRNLAAVIDWELGDVEAGFAQADYIFEDTYYSPKVQQAPIEPHIAMTWWDEDDRLVIR
ncbi:MAG TPA: 2Fe-2S iron-sulfur cluster-binding protein, partial [Aggregatilineales bacterium]|nr:2Fe-2S iron-sulfur cluster-binding protein [Aggregatilineales bacterium]